MTNDEVARRLAEKLKQRRPDQAGSAAAAKRKVLGPVVMRFGDGRSIEIADELALLDVFDAVFSVARLTGKGK
tara:strand:+ start:231 stop:449 length:219 start_codon:yes stop_codon:yes gene_type:complete